MKLFAQKKCLVVNFRSRFMSEAFFVWAHELMSHVLFKIEKDSNTSLACFRPKFFCLFAREDVQYLRHRAKFYSRQKLGRRQIQHFHWIQQHS